MKTVCLFLLLAAEPPASFDVGLDALPPYATGPAPEVTDATRPEAVDWESPAPRIRTSEEYREAKNRGLPVIWFEGALYFLTPTGEYRDRLETVAPTPTPRSVGEVEFSNGTQAPVEFHFRIAYRPESTQSVKVLPYQSHRVVLPLGFWQYAVVGARPSPDYASRGEFSVEPEGITHVLYGFPGRSVERARHWVRREDQVSADIQSASPAQEKPLTASEEKISRILASIPRYPDSLHMELPLSIPNYALYKTLDSEAKILAFYEQAFRENGWEIADRRPGRLSGLKTDRKAVIEILPSPPRAPSRQILLKVYPLE